MSEKLLVVTKEYKIGHEDWYELKVDDELIYGSYSFEKVMSVYHEIKKNKDLVIMQKEVLVSEKI